MKLRLARLLIVAFALLVPVQGMAALSQGICMSFGHHDGAAAPHHHHSGTPVHDDGQAEGAHCGPCVACCSGVASIAPSLLGAAPGALPDSVDAPFAVAPPGELPEQLDRPPLSL